jgi:hypothetical protein
MVNFSKSVIKFIIAILLISFMINLPFSFAQTKNRAPVYVGSEACKQCHESEYKNFMMYAKKSTSFKSIERVKRGLTEEEIKGCYFCHTTGYGKPGGEVCHGPGEFHIKTGSPKDTKRRMTIKDCEVCHISERVRAFRYKPMIHGGAH